MTHSNDIDIDDILEDSSDFDSSDVEESRPTQKVFLEPELVVTPEPKVPVGSSREEIVHLRNRLQSWNENCRDLFVDMTAINYVSSPDDTYIEFGSKEYYDKKLYFKTDPQSPKDPKVILAAQQFCKVLGVPYPFFSANRPSLKMNIVKTWQAGLLAQQGKIQNILKIRESKDCAIIRAFIPMVKSTVQLSELIDIVLNSLDIPVTMEFVDGDDKDDLILHARFLFEKEYMLLQSPVRLGFSLVASELNASPMVVEIFLHDKMHATSYIASYGGSPFFKSKYEELQAKQVKDIFPRLLNRIDNEAVNMISSVERKIQDSSEDGHFCAETECMSLMKSKGFSGKIKKAVYHQITECQKDIKGPWDIARHVGLVAKDFDSLKRLDIERAIGKYLNLIFAKE
jgi:hypothetical protein